MIAVPDASTLTYLAVFGSGKWVMKHHSFVQIHFAGCHNFLPGPDDCDKVCLRDETYVTDCMPPFGLAVHP